MHKDHNCAQKRQSKRARCDTVALNLGYTFTNDRITTYKAKLTAHELRVVYCVFLLSVHEGATENK